MRKLIVIPKKHEEYLKELGKDLSLFSAGIFLGPIIDASQLAVKHMRRIRELRRQR